MTTLRRTIVIALATGSIACGSSEPEATSATPAATPPAAAAATPTPAPSPAPAPTVAEAPAPAEARPVPAAPPVDLLRAVPATVTVSSVYHDETTQIARLADGDLASAWNSRTGDLVGAWIQVHLPDDATVSSIEMTAGFTREGGRADLFTGNHRVARVRVTHGETTVEQDLDVESRALQPIAVSGGGGDWRIEILRVVPGSRTDWQEICVSELRVLGTPGATAAAGSTPTFELAPADPAAAEAAADAAEAAEDALDEVADLVMAHQSEWEDQHLLEPVAGMLAAEAAVQARIDAAGAALPVETRCSWQGARMRVRLARLSERLERISGDQITAMRDVDSLPVSRREQDRQVALIEARSNAVEEAIDAIDRLSEPESDVAVARRIVAAQAPTIPDVDLGADWADLRAACEQVTAACARR